MMKTFLTALILSLATVTVAAQSTFYVVRHAEKKVEKGNRDPELSKQGLARAQELARVLKSVKVDRFLATGYKRTQMTLRPAATARKLKVETYDPRVKAPWFKALIAKKGCSVIAGHSNTVPAILRHLGVDKSLVPKLSDGDYDNLFMVHISKAGVVMMQHLHYGAAPAKK